MSEVDPKNSPEEFVFQEPVVTIGKFLRSEREQKDISLKVVSQHTKISLTMLTYLEDEDYESLPDLVYVRGFVKNYCKTLGISENVGLKILEETYASINKNTADIKAEAESLQNPETLETNNNMKFLSIAVIAVVFVAIIISMTRSGDKTHSTENAAKKEEIKKIAQKPKPKPTVNVIKPISLSAKTPLNKEMPTPLPTAKIVATPLPTVAPTAAPKATPTAVITDTTEEKKEESNVEKTAEETQEGKKIDFKRLSSSLYSFSPDSETVLQEEVPSDIKESIVSGKQNVFIKATDGDTWITYKTDGEPVKKFILKQGRHILIRGDEVTAFLGNVNVTKIFLNNKLLEINSRTGVKSLVFPQERTDKHLYPLFIYNDDGSVTSSYDYRQKNESVENQ